jgi:hypothetical protein
MSRNPRPGDAVQIGPWPGDEELPAHYIPKSVWDLYAGQTFIVGSYVPAVDAVRLVRNPFLWPIKYVEMVGTREVAQQ